MNQVVFLVDVDNTLLDNDHIQADIKAHLERQYGAACRDRYWAILDDLFVELGYRDYLGALQRYRVEHPQDMHLLSMSSFLVDYPFANRLYPGSLDVLERLRQWGPTVLLTDGDVVFQPRKVERSGLSEAVNSHVLIYIHKELALDDVESRYPALHYVLVDDKPRILAAVKDAWGSRVTTVFPRQGQYAHDAKALASFATPDVTVDRIGDLLDCDLGSLLTARPRSRSCAEVKAMKATQKLHELGQSIWLDNITRDLLTSGTLRRYIDELSLTGLTSNPTIFDQAIKSSSDYDLAIRGKLKEGKSGESLFFELAIEDLAQAADLFRPIWDRTNGVDGWVSLEVSPLLAHDTASTIAAAKELHARAKRPNLFIKIPGTKEGLPAIEEIDFRRRARECDPVVQPGALPRRGRGLSAGHRAAHCSRSKSKCWLRCVGLRQSLGCRRREQSARALTQSSSVSQSRNEHTRQLASCSPQRARGAFTTRVGGHSVYYGRAREPRIQRRPTSYTSRR